jgi:hypothetical protein
MDQADGSRLRRVEQPGGQHEMADGRPDRMTEDFHRDRRKGNADAQLRQPDFPLRHHPHVARRRDTAR